MEQKFKNLELKAWLYMFIIAVILVAIGLIIYLVTGSGSVADFFSSLTKSSIIILITAAVVVIAGIILLVKLTNSHSRTVWSVKELVVASMCLALAYVLSYIKIYEMPNGGSITAASMLPIFVFAYIYGPLKGLLVSFLYFLLQLTQGVYYLSLFQFLLDYFFGFTLLGVAGFFRKSIIPGIIAGGFMRFLSSFLAGVIFYGEYAPEGQSPFVYSLLYNGSFMLAEIVVCVVVAIIPLMHRTIESLKKQAQEIKSTPNPA